MRKLLSITLLLAVLLPFLSPALAWGANEDARLPACCRRSGAHHCTGGMSAATPADGHHHFSAAHNCCPLFPHALAATHPFSPASARYVAVFAHTTAHVLLPVPTHRQTLRDRSRSQRGPPRA